MHAHTRTHTKAIEETGMDLQASVDWRSDIEEGNRVGIQRAAITVSSNNVVFTIIISQNAPYYFFLIHKFTNNDRSPVLNHDIHIKPG